MRGRSSFRATTNFLTLMFACGATFGLILISGCGGPPPPSPSTDGTTERSTAPPSSPGNAAVPHEGSTTAENPSQGSESAVHNDAEGRKWIGEIPYDVWFDDPLEVAADDQRVAAVEQPAAPADPSEMELRADPEPDDSGEGDLSGEDWRAIIPVDVLEEEAKKVANRLRENMQTLGRFNSNFLEVQWEGATLAAVGGLLVEHPDSISWKENARHVRELGVQIEQAATERGKPAFDASRLPFEQFESILRGDPPSDLPEAADRVPFSESAGRAGLMRRMERSSNWLSRNILTEAAFEAEAEELRHEAALLVALSNVIAMPDYVFADEDDYQQYAREMIEAGREMQQAIEAEDFDNYKSAIDRVQTKCNECHAAGYQF